MVHEAPDTQTAHMVGGREINALGNNDTIERAPRAVAPPLMPSGSASARNVGSPFDDPETQGPHNVSTFSLAHQSAERIQDDNDNRELEQLQEEMARVRERRERLEELHALSEREAELKRAIARRRGG